MVSTGLVIVIAIVAFILGEFTALFVLSFCKVSGKADEQSCICRIRRRVELWRKDMLRAELALESIGEICEVFEPMVSTSQGKKK